MNGKLGKKAAILVVAGLMATTSGVSRADHDVDIVTPLVTLVAVGALLSYDRASHHYHHYYRYKRHGHYGSHYRGHSSRNSYRGHKRHGYHGHKRHGYGHYRKRQSSHGYYAQPRRRSHSHGGSHRY